MAILSIIFTVIIVAVSILIVLVVLVQRPKQEGLGAAFGGGTLDSALGAHTTDVLQKATTVLGVIFFVSAIGLAMVKTREFRASAASDVLEGVDSSETSAPDLPPSLSDLPRPDESEPAPADPLTEPSPADPLTDEPVPDGGFDFDALTGGKGKAKEPAPEQTAPEQPQGDAKGDAEAEENADE
ncbi:MAG: preprotein translocase subunit SecG [Verrucomicrobiales bacterium]